MFPIKQYILNLSHEARSELRKLLDEIDASLAHKKQEVHQSESPANQGAAELSTLVGASNGEVENSVKLGE